MKKKSNKARVSILPIPEAKYHRLLAVLVGGQDMSGQNQIFYDLGPGERPQVAMAHIRHVARKEDIDVEIDFANRNKQSIRLTFPKAREITVEIIVDE